MVSVVVRGGCMDVQWCFQNFPQGGDMSVDQGRGEVNYCERGVITSTYSHFVEPVRIHCTDTELG